MGVLDDVMLEAGNSKEKKTITIKGFSHPAVIVSSVRDCKPLWNPDGNMRMWAHMSSWDYYFFLYGYTTYKTWETVGNGEKSRLYKIQVSREDVEAIAAYLSVVYDEQKGRFDWAELYDKFPFLNHSKFMQRCIKRMNMEEDSIPAERLEKDTFKHPSVYRRWIPSLFARRVITGKQSVSLSKAKKKVDWMIYNLTNPVTNCPFAMQDIALGEYLLEFLKEHGEKAYLTVYDYIGFYYFTRDYYHMASEGKNLAQEQALAYKTIEVIKELGFSAIKLDSSKIQAIGELDPYKYLRLIGDYAILPRYLNPYLDTWYIKNPKEVAEVVEFRGMVPANDTAELSNQAGVIRSDLIDELKRLDSKMY